jgi:serine/threonine-protein kinase
MGVVYLAISTGVGGFNKVLVIKELKPELVEEQSFLEMFLEEARLAAQLNHPNIVTTYEVGIDGKRPFIVMDYLEGQTLARIQKKSAEKITLPMTLRALSAALEGLHYAHTRETFDGSSGSVVHRDVSPQNIFVTYDGQVKVVDFGIAKASDTTIETRAGTFKGKPSYMAPEAVRGDVSGRSDIFSIGVILWETLAKRRLWPKMSDVEVLTALLRGEIPSIDEFAPDAPAELRRIVSKATAADAEKRYETAHQMAVDLDDYLAKIGERSSLIDFGTAVATAFAEDRAKVRKLVEKAIADSKSADADTRMHLPSIAPPSDESSHPSRPRGDTPISSATPPVTPSLGTAGRAAIALEAASAPPPKASSAKWVALAIVAVAAVAIVFLLKKQQTPVAANPAPPPPSAAAAPPPMTSEPVAAKEVPPPLASAPASASASATASASASAAPRTTAVPTRVVYVHTPAPSPAPKPSADPAAKASAKPDCNPPFYYEGTKKIFKPGCL